MEKNLCKSCGDIVTTYKVLCNSCKELGYNSKYKMLERIFNNQVYNSKSRGHKRPSYSKEEFISRFLNDNAFISIYNTCKDNNFVKDLKPSFDRINEEEGYSFSNIRLVTWGENNQRQRQEIINGKKLSYTREVLQYSGDGEFISEYKTCNLAGRTLAPTYRKAGDCISDCCRGRKAKYKGYYWFFKDEFDNSILKRIQDQKSKQKSFKRGLPIPVVVTYDNTTLYFSSIVECAKELNLDRSYLHTMLHGVIKRYKGYELDFDMRGRKFNEN